MSTNNPPVSIDPNLLAYIDARLAQQQERLQEQFATAVSTALNDALHPLQERIAALSPDDSRPSRLKVNSPPDFDGSRTEGEGFKKSCTLYMMLRSADFDTTRTATAWILSYMTEGSAAAWRRNYIKAHVLPTGHLLFPSTDTFNEEIRQEFEPTFSKEDALEQLKSLRQGNTPIDSHNIAFKGLVAQAGIKGETVNVISLYQDSIRMPLLAKILSNEEPGNLTTIEDWYNKATQHEKQWLRLKQIQERFRGHRGNDNDYRNNSNNRYQGTKKFTPQMRTWRNYAGGSNNNQRSSNTNSYRSRYDPNAMDTSADAIDIDAMSPEKLELMKKGACFNCEERGHRAAQCPKKGKSFEKPKDKWTGKSAATYIRNMMSEMDDEEADIAMNELAKEGF